MVLPSLQIPAEVLGPILIGAFLNAIFYGGLIVQASSYFQSFPRDPWFTHLFVSYLLVVETLSTGFDLGLAYEPLIIREREEALDTVPTMLATVGAVTVFVSTPVQIYFAMRLRVVLGNNILPFFVIFFSMVSFTGGILTSVNVVRNPTFESLKEVTWGPTLWLATTAFTDLLITVALSYFLYKNKSGLRQFDSVVNRIIMSTIQTGALTSIAATADFIVFLAAHGNYNFIWDLALAKLYTNALLSTLNARKAWNDLVDERRHWPTTTNLSFVDVEKALTRSSNRSHVTIGTRRAARASSGPVHRRSLISESFTVSSQFRSSRR